MKTIKWIIAGLVPAFTSGGSMLAAGMPMDAKFWFFFTGTFLGGLAGISVNKVVDNMRGGGE